MLWSLRQILRIQKVKSRVCGSLRSSFINQLGPSHSRIYFEQTSSISCKQSFQSSRSILLRTYNLHYISFLRYYFVIVFENIFWLDAPGTRCPGSAFGVHNDLVLRFRMDFVFLRALRLTYCMADQVSRSRYLLLCRWHSECNTQECTGPSHPEVTKAEKVTQNLTTRHDDISDWQKLNKSPCSEPHVSVEPNQGTVSR